LANLTKNSELTERELQGQKKELVIFGKPLTDLAYFLPESGAKNVFINPAAQ
jgi:hypothetical protein